MTDDAALRDRVAVAAQLPLRGLALVRVGLEVEEDGAPARRLVAEEALERDAARLRIRIQRHGLLVDGHGVGPFVLRRAQVQQHQLLDEVGRHLGAVARREPSPGCPPGLVVACRVQGMRRLDTKFNKGGEETVKQPRWARANVLRAVAR